MTRWVIDHDGWYWVQLPASVSVQNRWSADIEKAKHFISEKKAEDEIKRIVERAPAFAGSLKVVERTFPDRMC